MRKILIALAAGALVAVVAASASVLLVEGGAIQYGTDGVECDANGVEVLGWGLETDTNTVDRVRVGGVDDLCDGADLFIRVLNNGGEQIAYSGAIPIVASTPQYVLNFPAPEPPQNIGSIQVWIEGGLSP